MNTTRRRKKKKSTGIQRCRYCSSSVSIKSHMEMAEQLREGRYYVCNNPDCRAYVRIRPGTNLPDGEMADACVRHKRKEAHHYFDQIHANRLMTRMEGYEWLGYLFRRPDGTAHIKYLTEYECQILIERSITVLKGNKINIIPFIDEREVEHHD